VKGVVHLILSMLSPARLMPTKSGISINIGLGLVVIVSIKSNISLLR
jgi:hypothetical protein